MGGTLLGLGGAAMIALLISNAELSFSAEKTSIAVCIALPTLPRAPEVSARC
jgi:hypothetical protein